MQQFVMEVMLLREDLSSAIMWIRGILEASSHIRLGRQLDATNDHRYKDGQTGEALEEVSETMEK